MEKENKPTKPLICIIIILIIIILGLIFYIIYDKFISNKNTIINTQNQNLSNEIYPNTQEQSKIYKSYNVGDKISLLDSSYWNVLENSSKNDKFVTLLRVDNINTDYTITFTNAQSYISSTYKSNLISKLNASNNDIKEARLLTLEDISKLSNIEISNLEPGTSLENGITPSFLYQNTTITSKIDDFGCPIMIDYPHPEYNDPGKICEGTQTDTEPIRPVITISKDYIK